MSRHRMTTGSPLTMLWVPRLPPPNCKLPEGRGQYAASLQASGCQAQGLQYWVISRNWELVHRNKKLIYELRSILQSA